MENWKYKFYRSFWNALDLLFPPTCGGCGKNGSRWCVECQERVMQLNGILCDVCGLPQDRSGVCDLCLADRPHFHSLRAWTAFEAPVQHALHRLKYRRDIAMGDALAAQMTSFVMDLDWPIDMVVPIPLGRNRMKERGYNQVAMIAKPLAMALEIRYAPHELMRNKETRSQVGLSREERRVNVKEAFHAGAGAIGKNILVMDDVSTTGSTLSAAAMALYAIGAKEVYALTVARALPHHGLRHV
ncbi:MAG: ComF family protein [Chloroflexi bacterium]|nr:ComF family protein [Chloroflexota bacterium]